MKSGFNLSVLGKDVNVEITLVNSEEIPEEKKEWVKNLIIGDIKQVWESVKDQEYLVDIRKCNWTGNINVAICLESFLFSDNISYFLATLSIELMDQILEKFDEGLSGKTYADLGGFSVLSLKTDLYLQLSEYIVDAISELVEDGQEVEGEKSGELENTEEETNEKIENKY